MRASSRVCSILWHHSIVVSGSGLTTMEIYFCETKALWTNHGAAWLCAVVTRLIALFRLQYRGFNEQEVCFYISTLCTLVFGNRGNVNMQCTTWVNPWHIIPNELYTSPFQRRPRLLSLVPPPLSVCLIIYSFHFTSLSNSILHISFPCLYIFISWG